MRFSPKSLEGLVDFSRYYMPSLAFCLEKQIFMFSLNRHREQAWVFRKVLRKKWLFGLLIFYSLSSNFFQVLDSFGSYPFRPYQEALPPAPAPVNPIQANDNCQSFPIPKKEVRTETKQIRSHDLQTPIGNGGYAEKYYWTQTIKEATIYIDMWKQTRGKDVGCVISPRHLTISVFGESFINGELEDAIKAEESMWTLSNDSGVCQIIVTLEKVRQTWWKHIMIGDPEIDTTKVI
jgi:hypothetical protein